MTATASSHARLRRFDHDEAVRRRAAGETVAALAAEYGVTESAIYLAVKRATDPGWKERNNAHSRDYQRRTLKTGTCTACGATIWRRPDRNPTGLCLRCLGESRRVTVRAAALRCSECGEWKHDQDFPRRNRSPSRRFRHSVCRDCQAVVRQRARDARKVPCRACGAPTTNPKDNLGHGRNTGLCLRCYRQSPEFAETQRRAVEVSRVARIQRRARKDEAAA